MKLDNHQRAFVADKLMDTANFAVAGLVFGQLVTKVIQLTFLLLGLFIYAIGWIVTVRLRKGVSDK